jgi:XTP/dITP diphosphohydrolase
MGFPPRIAIATRNPHKIKEITRICSDWPVSWLTVHDAGAQGVPEVEETGETYLDNASLKARTAAGALGVPALADDSGIEVDALGGRPGVRSARYAGERATDDENLRELLRAIKGVPAGGRTARYRCLAVLSSPDGTLMSAEGVCEGTLVAAPRGEGGFGYDPVFVPAGWDETMAQLPAAEKDRISHRGKAFRALRAAIEGAMGTEG